MSNQWYNQPIQNGQNKEYEQITSMHAGTIVHTKIFNEAKQMITLGNDGEVHLYSLLLNKWSHKCISKLYNNLLFRFDNTIVCYDLKNNFGRSYLAAVSYSGQIKICRLDQEEIIVQEQIDCKIKSPIVSCVWGGTENQLIITSQMGEIGFINRYQNKSFEIFSLNETKSKISPVLARQGKNTTYICTKNQLQTIELIETPNSKYNMRNIVLSLDSTIIDFAVSKEASFCSLIVVTQNQILFYIMLGFQTVQTSAFDTYHPSFGSRLGWGSTEDEIGLYQCINGVINVRVFKKMMDGSWYQDTIDKKLRQNDMSDQ